MEISIEKLGDYVTEMGNQKNIKGVSENFSKLCFLPIVIFSAVYFTFPSKGINEWSFRKFLNSFILKSLIV